MGHHKHNHHHAPPPPHHSDYYGNGWVVFVSLLFLAGMITFIVLFAIHPYPQAPTPIVVSKKRNNAYVLRRDSAPRTQCTVSETYDAEAGRCGPVFHAPLAFDGSIMDNQEQPCDSFYRAMCGRWNDQHTNDNRAFAYGYVKNQARIAKLINFETTYRNGALVATTPSTSSITDFYRSCIRSSKRTRNGASRDSILEHTHMMRKMLGSAAQVSDMPAVFGKLARAGYTAPFTLSIERHPTEPRMMPLFTWDGFPPDLNEAHIILLYRNTRDIHQLDILQLEQHVQSVVAIIRACRLNNRRPLSSITDYEQYVKEQFARDVMRFDALPQAWNVRGHERMTSGWNVYFQELDGTGLRFHHDQEVWVIDKPYFDWLFNFGLAEFTFKDWYAFVEFSVLWNSHDFVPQLPNDVYFKQHERRGPLGPGAHLYNRLKRDTSKEIGEDVEKKCVRITQHLLPGLVAKQFLKQHFPNKEAIKEDVHLMVRDIIGAFVHQVRQTPWMSEADKSILVDKMHSTLIRVAEPDQWEAEPFAERINPDLYWHNLNMIRAYRVQRNLALWSRDNVTAFDRSAVAFFAIPLTSVNAYYSGPTNTITVLAGILQHPFFNADYNAISKYAILGSILGHELSHMADNHGLYWGRQGSLHPNGILSTSGMEAFYRASECVVREYGPAPLGCEAANAHYGNSTLGEDLADLTGIHLAWLAYLKRYTNSQLDDKQHFFMVLAQAFCETYDQQHLCEAVANDEHAIAMFRINRTFRNLEAFQQAFSCHTGHGMYKNTTQMCKVYGN